MSVANWSLWTKFWFGDADLIVSGTASVLVVVDVNTDWQLFDEATEFNGTIFDDWSSAVFWVADTFELRTTVGFSGAFFTVSTSRRNNNSDLFTGDAVGLLVSFSGFGASGGVANTRFATATRVSRLEKSFVDVADWVSVVKWARFLVTLASPDWATFVGVIRVVSKDFDFTESTGGADWTFWAVFGDLFSALDWLTPFFGATSSGIGTDSFDFKLVARNSFVVTFNELFDDHTWRVASARSFDTFVFLSAVVLVPEFTGSMFNSAFISANVAISWVDTFITLKNESFSTEATLFNAFNHTPSFVKTVQLVVVTSFWNGWPASGPFFVGIFAGLSRTSQVVVLTVSEVWNDVLVSPVVDTVSSVTRTLLSKVVYLFTSSVETFDNIERAFVVFAVERKIVVTSVQVVVWIGDLSAVVQVRVNVNSVTFVCEFGFALVTWEVFWETFWSFDTFVGWAANLGTFQSWDHFKFVEVVSGLSSSARFFRWHNAFVAITSFFHADTGFGTDNVFVVGPNVRFVSGAFEVVDHWTFTSGGWLAFSGVAASIEVIDGEFTFFAGSEFGFSPDSNGARFIAGTDPSKNTFTFDVFARVFWVTFGGANSFAIAEHGNWVTSFFVFLQTLRIAGYATVEGVASTLTAVAVVGSFIPSFSMGVFNTINETFLGVSFWDFTPGVFFVDSVGSWEFGWLELHDPDWVDGHSFIVGVVTIAGTAKTKGTLSVRRGVRNGPFLVDWVVFDGEFEFSKVKPNIVTLFGGRITELIIVVGVDGEFVDLNSVLGKNKVVGQSVNVLVNVVFDSKRLDLFLEVSNNFKVHVASVMSDPVFASISLSQFKVLSIVRLNQVGVGFRTLAGTFTAHIASTASTVC